MAKHNSVVSVKIGVKRLTLDRMVDTTCIGYYECLALKERIYKIVKEKESGKMVQEYLTSYATITYAELKP